MLNMPDKFYSKEHLSFLKRQHRRKSAVAVSRLLVFVLFFSLWELAARLEWIDAFIFSSPSRSVATLLRLASDSSLIYHTGVTFLEALLGFFLGNLIGFVISAVLWYFPFADSVTDPYLVVLNSLPKIALGPIIIVWVGAGFSSILTVTLLVSVICTITGVLSGFKSVEPEKETLLFSFGATRIQVFFHCVLPATLPNIIAVLKINVGMTWVGVIVGEFLVSKAGLGYLIVYGGQVFRMDLVIGSVLILCFLSVVMYGCIALLESAVKKRTT